MATKAKQDAKQEKVPAREAAQIVLLNAGRPMHYREITTKAIEQGIVKVRGNSRKKPDLEKTVKTVRAFLCEHEGTRFVRVGPGVFDLKDRKAAAARAQELLGTKAPAAKPKAAKAKA